MKKTLILILSAILLDIFTISAKEQYIFTQISQKEGLTSTIDCIYKELNGNVWISSRKGLYRFNGYTLYHYEDSLFKGRRVTQAKVDRYGNLWVLTDNWLLCRERRSEDFRFLGLEHFESSHTFYSMCCNDEYAWFGSYGRIFRYSYKDGTLSLFRDLRNLPDFPVRYMNLISEDTMLCCSNTGIIYIDINTGDVSEASYSSTREVSSVYVDSRHRIWLAFYNQGIEVYDSSGTKIKSYNTANSGLSNNIVLCMTERNSEIWAGTDGGGINIINPDTDAIEVMSHIPGDPSSLPAHSIKSIYTDQHNNIWAGSVRDGLICISYSKMNTYTDAHIGLKHGLSNSTVLSLFQDKGAEHIWIGTDGEGINRFDPVSNLFTHYESTLKMKVVSIAGYSPSELLISVYADGLWIFNKNTGAIRPLKIDSTDLDYQMRFTGRSINLLNEDERHIILYGNKMQRLDRKTGRCTPVTVSDSPSSSNLNIFYVGETDKGHWFHNSNSIYFLECGSGNLELAGRTDEFQIVSAQADGDGIIWLGTNKGLSRFSIKRKEFLGLDTSYVIEDATNVVCDRQGRVWVGTDTHLYAYLPETENFALFGESDGARPNEYLNTPHLLASNGDVYMGGVQGLLKIDNDFTIDASEVPQLALYEFTVDSNRMKPDRNGVYRLPRNSHSLSISVSTHETDIFRKKRYRFFISGKNQEIITERPTLALKQLPAPGTYDVSVSCTKRDGEWSQPVNILKFTVPQPWYFTGWFITVLILVIILIFFAVFISIHLRKSHELKLAMKEQEQKLYEEKVGLLINISHELRTPLTLIMAPLKRLLKGMKPEDDNFVMLNRIYRQSRRMRDMLNMVLDLRKMEVGKNRLKIESTDLNKWILETIEDLVNEEKAEGISIVTELDPGVGIVEIDRNKCDTVLMNILMNAVKHSVAGDTIRIRTSVNGARARVSVSDEGPGLVNIDKSEIFTNFYQSTTEQYGSGIGLAYSKILVNLHGGEIGAENNEDKGAVFWWEIPVSQEDKGEERMAPARAYLNELMANEPSVDMYIPEYNGFSTIGMTLMLVDDSQDLLDFIKESLSGEFKEIYTFTGGNPAFRQLCSGRLPDIIVSDVNMPDGDGYTLCRQIKENEKFRHIPVVLLTARGEEKSQSDSYRLGADAFLAKPFEIETLLEMVRSLLRGKDEIRKQYFGKETSVGTDYGSNEESFILRFNKIVAEHISDVDLDQNLLCRELGISRALLYAKMKAITGTGAKEYITRIRIEKAKQLIETTNLSVSDISDMTGFSAQSYFSTAFKNYTGRTPSQYRQDVRAAVEK